MVTNTFAPHVGGVARSVASFTDEFRRRGHRVLVIAPTFDQMPATELDVVRVRSLQKFNGSGFSVAVMPPHHVAHTVDAFRPDVIHSHHPFLLGSMALRLAKSRGVPLVFTHHTLYEQYTHYMPGNSSAMKRFIVQLSTNYANLASHVFAPSPSIAALLEARGVTVPLSVVPTGVDLNPAGPDFVADLRAELGLPEGAPVIGTVGRLAAEKNLDFLAQGMIRALAGMPASHALIVGEGPAAASMRAAFAAAGLAGRVRFAGTLTGATLAAAYRLMSVFAFASVTETQGLVLAEAMTAGVPVVALDASGARDVMEDGCTGRLLTATADTAAFAAAIVETVGRRDDPALAAALAARAETASIGNCAGLALDAYASLSGRPFAVPVALRDIWRRAAKRLAAERDLIVAATGAAGAALRGRRPG